MNSAVESSKEQQLRKAAIFVASLDESVAEQVLADMAPADAKAVRAAMALLEEVPESERRQIADQFRSSVRNPPPTSRSTDGVELDPSLLARLENSAEDEQQASPAARKPTLGKLTEAETSVIVEALRHENPQTMAVVVSRMDHSVAAAILCQLPEHLQTEVLTRLAHLDPADAESVHVVESHLAEWVERQRQRKQRLAAGADLVQQILEKTPDGNRGAILARLSDRLPDVVGRFQSPVTIPIAAEVKPKPTTRPRSIPRKPQAAALSPAVPQAVIGEPLQELESASDAMLMRAITHTDRQVVTLALAGASDRLLSRILRRLPRRQAKEFRERLRNIGPTRLGDMLAAQQQLADNIH